MRKITELGRGSEQSGTPYAPETKLSDSVVNRTARAVIARGLPFIPTDTNWTRYNLETDEAGFVAVLDRTRVLVIKTYYPSPNSKTERVE